MKPLNTFLLLLFAVVLVFAQARWNGLRSVVGAQVDALPSLVVYASLSTGWVTLTALSVVGGLSFDALSANPLGVSILPLFLIGFLIFHYRGLILREQTYAQIVIGAAASAGAPLLTLLLMLNTEARPLVSWFSIWQWLVMAVGGALLTPLWFRLFDLLNSLFNYRPLGETAFRPDREIKRGRQ